MYATMPCCAYSGRNIMINNIFVKLKIYNRVEQTGITRDARLHSSSLVARLDR